MDVDDIAFLAFISLWRFARMKICHDKHQEISIGRVSSPKKTRTCYLFEINGALSRSVTKTLEPEGLFKVKIKFNY